jgi:hypothetical protein
MPSIRLYFMSIASMAIVLLIKLPSQQRFVLMRELAALERTHPKRLKQSRMMATASSWNATTTTSRSGAISVGVLSPRVYRQWPAHVPLPCYAPGAYDIGNLKIPRNATIHQGFLFTKPFKTGSSTSAGIHLRMARNVARRTNQTFGICQSRFDHGLAPYPGYFLFHNRSIGQSFLWTVIRKPTARSISQFFHFQVSRRNVTPSDTNFKRYLVEEKSKRHKDYYIRSLSTRVRYSPREHNATILAQHILEDYDFIGITERMDESAVVLMMLLNLKLSDIVYISSKTAGSYDAGGGKFSGCTRIQPSFVSANMSSFLKSKKWYKVVRNDVALYRAANKSLDMTIDTLGREDFESKLAIYRKAQTKVHQECRPFITFPCTEEGRFVPPKRTDCLWKDSGCGMECLDRIATEMNLF